MDSETDIEIGVTRGDVERGSGIKDVQGSISVTYGNVSGDEDTARQE